MKKVFISFSAVLFVFCTAFATEVCAKNEGFDSLENSVPTITVQGEGKISIIPDEACAYFGVKSEERTLEKAYKTNIVNMNSVIASVKSLDIDPVDIKSLACHVTPVYPLDEKGRKVPGKPVAFSVSQQLKVKIRDVSKVGKVIDKVIASGGNTFGGLNFTSSKNDKLRKEVSILAAKDAKEKASLLADSLGVSLGRVLRAGGTSPFTYAPGSYKTAGFSNAAMDVSPQIEAGAIEVNGTCNVVYEIIQ